ncbi:hypothetical protein VXM67_08710 [Pseudomonas sp. Rh2]|uniref:hypothetical protein n=1 Tax=unclassified Pseudomonas TaxID=196821 RepID=UPI00345CB8E9
MVSCYDIYLKPVLVCCSFIFVYALAAILFPFSGPEGVAYGVVLLLLFIGSFLIFTFGFFGVGSRLLGGKFLSVESRGGSFLPFVLSVIGIVLIIIDRVYFRGVDFLVMSPAEIRNKVTAESAGGVSSVFSLLGNVLQCFVVISALNSIFNDTGLRLFLKQAVFIMVVFASSYLLGGRTPLMTYIVIVFSIYVASGRAISVFSALKFIFPASLFALIFALSIFSLRARAVGIDSAEYLSAILVHLGAEEPSTSLSSGEWGADVLNFFYVVLAYLLHPFWVASEIVIDPERGGNISFYAILFLFSKFLPIDLEGAKHVYYELFSSLPGGLYYDYGLSGLLAYSFVLAGIGFSGLMMLLASKGASKIGFVIIVFCLGTLLLAPLLHSLNFVFFIFYMASLFCYAAVKDFRRVLSYGVFSKRVVK